MTEGMAQWLHSTDVVELLKTAKKNEMRNISGEAVKHSTIG